MDYPHHQTAAEYELSEFLQNAPKLFREGERIKKYQLGNGDYIHCVLWFNHFYITGTDIVKILVWRFQAANRQLGNMKKFEEGIFSDLRNLKPGMDASLEGPRSDFLEFLYKSGCIRTQKKQKVFYWYSVPHQDLFNDALDRDRRRDHSMSNYNGYIPDRRIGFGDFPVNKFGGNQRATGPGYYAPVGFELGKHKEHMSDMKNELFNLKSSQAQDYRGKPVGNAHADASRERKTVLNDFNFDNLFSNTTTPKMPFKGEDLDDESKLNKINYDVGNLFKQRFKDPIFTQSSGFLEESWPLNLANSTSNETKQIHTTNRNTQKQAEDEKKKGGRVETSDFLDPFDFKNFTNK